MVSELNRCVGLTADAETALANMVFGLAVTPTFAVQGLSILAAKAYIEVVGEEYRDTLISVYDSAMLTLYLMDGRKSIRYDCGNSKRKGNTK